MERNNPPKIPAFLLLALCVLVVGILIASQVNRSTDKGTLKKVQEKHIKEEEVYEATP